MEKKEGRWEQKGSKKISGFLGRYWEVELIIRKAFQLRGSPNQGSKVILYQIRNGERAHRDKG